MQCKQLWPASVDTRRPDRSADPPRPQRRSVAFPPRDSWIGSDPRGRRRARENARGPAPVPDRQIGGSLPFRSVLPRARPPAGQRRAQLQAATRDSKPCPCESRPEKFVHRPLTCLAHRSTGVARRLLIAIAPSLSNRTSPLRMVCSIRAISRRTSASNSEGLCSRAQLSSIVRTRFGSSQVRATATTSILRPRSLNAFQRLRLERRSVPLAIFGTSPGSLPYRHAWYSCRILGSTCWNRVSIR